MAPKAKNKDLQAYQKVQEVKKGLLKAEKKKIDAIRHGLEDTVVIFVDMVDSTLLKKKLAKKPEIWINKIHQFAKIVKAYVENNNGTPIKYIGDEVMAVFRGVNKIIDAINFLNRISEIEKDITEVSKSTTSIKISFDYGKVYYLKYEGHDQADPPRHTYR